MKKQTGRYLFYSIITTVIFCLCLAGETPKWKTYIPSAQFSNITGIVLEGEYVWIATAGAGLIKLEKETGEFIIYNNENSGLPGNSINSLAIDPNGVKWMVVTSKLVRFDGERWSIYDSTNSILPSNPSPRRVTVDNEGVKWILTRGGFGGMSFGGVITFNDTNWVTHDVGIPLGHWPTSIAFDTSNVSWIGVPYAGVFRYDGEESVRYNTENSGLPSDIVSEITVDLNDIKWIHTHGLTKFDGTEWTTYDTDNSEIPDNTINFIRPNDDGTIWVCTPNGLALFDGTNWTVYRTDNSGLPNNNVRSIEVSDNDTKWVGTTGGFARFTDTGWFVYDFGGSDLPHHNVRAIAIDAEGVKWIATRGGGLARYDGIDWTVYNTENSGLPDNRVNTIVIDNQNILWIGTEDGLAQFDGVNWTVYDTGNAGLPDNSITSIAIEDEGVKWVGMRSGLARYDAGNWNVYTTDNTPMIVASIFDIAIDHDNIKWIGTLVGMGAYDDNEWILYRSSSHHHDYPGDLVGEYVVAVAIDQKGIKWVGSLDDPFTPANGVRGLTIFNGQEWAALIRSTHGVTAIHVDRYNVKWIGTNNGLLRIIGDFEHEVLGEYTVENSGLPNQYINAIVTDEYDNKWIGTAGGLAVFNENGLGIVGGPDIEIPIEIPENFILHQNYPNPFNPSTTIVFELPENGHVRLKVYDVLGRLIGTLIDEQREANVHTVDFDASGLSSGVYIYRLSVGESVQTKRMVLIR